MTRVIGVACRASTASNDFLRNTSVLPRKKEEVRKSDPLQLRIPGLIVITKLSTKLAYHTLVWSWTVTGLAAIAVIFQTVVGYKHRALGHNDSLNILACLVGIALVILSTWAIVDEGQAEHQQNLSSSQVALAAKVSIGT